MAPRKWRVQADLRDLWAASEDSSIDHCYYLDLLTGEIILVSEHMDAEERVDLDEKVEGSYLRYAHIPVASSWEGYEDMEGFIETVEDADLRGRLATAVNGRGAFRRFKDVLLEYPEARERWLRFKDARAAERVLEWLECEGIKLVDAETR